jgi:ribosomal protein S18 acetylase RimI-like enzyme
MSGKWPHDFEDRGFTHSWILSLGVVRTHRKRGIASAMIARAMRDFADDGMEYAMLDVDSANPTGAYGLYEALGFVHARQTVALIKEVPPA